MEQQQQQTATLASMGQPLFGGGPMQMVQQQQWPQGFNPMEQQQQFYNQGMLSQMLMSQGPGGMSGVMAPQLGMAQQSGMGFGGGPMQMVQQQQWSMQQQQQQQQFYNQGMLLQMLMSQGPGRMSGVMAPQLGMAQQSGMGFGGGPMQMVQQQQWQQQQTQMGFSGGGLQMVQQQQWQQQQTGRITLASMGQSAGMIGQTASNMIPQTNRTMVPTTMMSQQATGMVPQDMNSAGGVPGIQQGVQGGQQVQGKRRKKKKKNKDEFLAQQQQQRNLQQQQANQQQQLAKYGPNYINANPRCRKRMKKNYRDAAYVASQMEANATVNVAGLQDEVDDSFQFTGRESAAYVASQMEANATVDVTGLQDEVGDSFQFTGRESAAYVASQMEANATVDVAGLQDEVGDSFQFTGRESAEYDPACPDSRNLESAEYDPASPDFVTEKIAKVEQEKTKSKRRKKQNKTSAGKATKTPKIENLQKDPFTDPQVPMVSIPTEVLYNLHANMHKFSVYQMKEEPDQSVDVEKPLVTDEMNVRSVMEQKKVPLKTTFKKVKNGVDGSNDIYKIEGANETPGNSDVTAEKTAADFMSNDAKA